MKRISAFILVCICTTRSLAQPKYFEGILVYHVTVFSKVPAFGNPELHKIFAVGDRSTVFVKNGNYLHRDGYSDSYYVPKDKKAYVKFRKLDTLYYIDYSSDSSQVTEITKPNEVFKWNSYPCKSITIKTAKSSYSYYYTDSLKNDPSFDLENTISLFNVYTRETGGRIFLWGRFESFLGAQTDSCIQVQEKSIDEHIFDLPPLPVKKLDIASLYQVARFPGKQDAWSKYLNVNLDPKLAIKYVKIPKGQSEGTESVIVQFSVDEQGQISNIEVLNKNEVNPHLAAEAVRVIRESPGWIPGSVYGEKLVSIMKQPVNFKVTN